MASTFAQLGIPFELFAAPVDQAAEYCGLGTCSICQSKAQHCFRLGIGCAIISACPRCETLNGLDADDRADGKCRACQGAIPFPDLEDDEIATCYACLRAGKAAITKDTELGMISWAQAFEGVTHGMPRLHHPGFEMVQRDGGWTAARLPQEMMFELLRTPTYSSIQGECWQFCCQRPMVFHGQWSREEFGHRAVNGDGRKLFEELIQGNVPGLWENQLHDVTGIYVFECPTCSRRTAIWDLA